MSDSHINEGQEFHALAPFTIGLTIMLFLNVVHFNMSVGRTVAGVHRFTN